MSVTDIKLGRCRMTRSSQGGQATKPSSKCRTRIDRCLGSRPLEETKGEDSVIKREAAMTDLAENA